MGAVAEAMAQRVDDQVALHVGHRPADQARRRARRDRGGVDWQASARPRPAARRQRGKLDRLGPIRRRRRAAPRGAGCSPARAHCPASGCASSSAAAAGERPRRGRPLAAAKRRGEMRRPAPRCRRGRSRSGGRCRVTTLRRKQQVLAEAAGPHLGRRGRGWWWRAAGYRPCTGAAPPTRSISRSWMARSSLACRRGSISLISSSSRVPPSASSNLPTAGGDGAGEGALLMAEQLGFQQVSGMAAQLTATKGPRRAAAVRGAGSARPSPCRCRSRR